jgi:FkbM family methyltransferase
MNVYDNRIGVNYEETLMKELLKSIVPTSARRVYRRWANESLVKEVLRLDILDFGVDEGGAPWIMLSDRKIFYGFRPTNTQLDIYRSFQKQLSHFREECFGVVVDIVNRYLVPRSLPGELVREPSRYMRLRDPLSDFDLPHDEKIDVARIFRPKAGDTFVDIGAYLGYGTMRVADLVGNNGHVVAFEADPVVGKLLQRNIDENNISNITVVMSAVSSSSGERSLFRCGGTANSLEGKTLERLGYRDLDKIVVRCETADNLLKNESIESVDFASITVNGAEQGALVGMRRTLSNSPSPKLTIAGWYRDKDGKRVADLLEPELVSLGFKVLKGRLGRVLAWQG